MAAPKARLEFHAKRPWPREEAEGDPDEEDEDDSSDAENGFSLEEVLRLGGTKVRDAGCRFWTNPASQGTCWVPELLSTALCGWKPSGLPFTPCSHFPEGVRIHHRLWWEGMRSPSVPTSWRACLLRPRHAQPSSHGLGAPAHCWSGALLLNARRH